MPETIPFLTVMSTDFEKDLGIIKRVLGQFEKRAHMEDAYRFSERAEMAAGWWFYDVFVTPAFLQEIFQMLLPPGERNPKSAAIKVVKEFQEQIKNTGSEARVKMHGDMPFAAPWWAWLMR
jgi:hypothetical protein